MFPVLNLLLRDPADFRFAPKFRQNPCRSAVRKGRRWNSASVGICIAVTRSLVRPANPTTAISSACWASVMPRARAAAVGKEGGITGEAAPEIADKVRL